jgi:hypothetical protein
MSNPRLTRADAIEMLRDCDVPLDSNFHALRTVQVASLLEAARHYGYRAPRNANGSRGRYFHAML